MRILILGASGYIGNAIKQSLANMYEVYGTYRTGGKSDDSSMYLYEVGNEELLRDILVEVEPDIVISCLRGDFGKQLKAHEFVAKYLQEKNKGQMIFLSSANVFDGDLEQPHFEEDIPEAESEYGKYKIECEKMLQSILGSRVIIIRIPEVWGRNCPRIKRLHCCIKEKIEMDTYENLYVNYTTDRQISEWILYIIKHELKGIFHVGTEDMYEYVKFQRELIKQFNLKEPIFKINREEEKSYFAVLSERDEIPKEIRLRVKDIIKYLEGSG